MRNGFFGIKTDSFQQLFLPNWPSRCEELVRGELATVKIYVAPATATVNTKSLRVALSDHVANIGW